MNVRLPIFSSFCPGKVSQIARYRKSRQVKEAAFLGKHGFSEDDVFDGREVTATQRKILAKEKGKRIVLGPACRRAGHRLFTRHGHCVQCDTAKIAFANRHAAAGYVYIAGSRQQRLIKIGGGASIEERERSLRAQSYGGAKDWCVLLHVQVQDYGRVESKTQYILRNAKTYGYYAKDGDDQRAKEIYRCSFSVARAALDEAIKSLSVRSTNPVVIRDTDAYEFRDGAGFPAP